MSFTGPPRKPVLVIGCGNDLRGDDAVGRVAANLVETAFVDCRTLSVVQLLPEHAEAIADSRLLILIDAAMNLPSGTVTCDRHSPLVVDHTSHGLGLGNILAMSRDLYRSLPDVYCIRVGAECFGLGDSLSPAVRNAIPTVLRHVRHLLDEYDTAFIP